MRFKNCNTLGLAVLALVFVSLFGMKVEAQMGQPDMVSPKGTLIDLTCAAKGECHDELLGQYQTGSHDAGRQRAEELCHHVLTRWSTGSSFRK